MGPKLPHSIFRAPITAHQSNTVAWSSMRVAAPEQASPPPRRSTSPRGRTAAHLDTTQRPVATYAPIKMLSSLQNPRQAAAQLMNFGLILSTAFMVGFPHLCSAC